MLTLTYSFLGSQFLAAREDKKFISIKNATSKSHEQLKIFF